MLDPSLQTTPLGGCNAVVGVVHVVRLVVGRAALGLPGFGLLRAAAGVRLTGVLWSACVLRRR